MSPDFFLEKTISRNHISIFFSHFQSIRQAILELKFSKFFHIGSVTSAFERLIPSSFRRSKLLLTIWFLSQQKVVYETYLVPKQVKRYVNWRFNDLIGSDWESKCRKNDKEYAWYSNCSFGSPNYELWSRHSAKNWLLGISQFGMAESEFFTKGT